MKTLLLVVLTVLAFNSVNAQSLAEVTGETKSLYNAICIKNNITPGDIGMTEFRQLAKEYAAEVGCKDYELYEYNGGNNLYILYFEPVKKAKRTLGEYTKEQIQEFLGEEIMLDDEYRNTPSTNCAGCGTIVVTDTVVEVVSVQYNISEVAPLQITMANLEEVTTQVPSKAPSDIKSFADVGNTCDCRGMDAEQLNNYYTQMLKLRRSATGNEKDKYGECAYQIRRYKQQVLKDSADVKLLERIQERVNRAKERDSQLVSSKVKPKKKSKIKRVRKPRGAKRTRGKSFTFWTRLFPFINC